MQLPAIFHNRRAMIAAAVLGLAAAVVILRRRSGGGGGGGAATSAPVAPAGSTGALNGSASDLLPAYGSALDSLTGTAAVPVTAGDVADYLGGVSSVIDAVRQLQPDVPVPSDPAAAIGDARDLLTGIGFQITAPGASGVKPSSGVAVPTPPRTRPGAKAGPAGRPALGTVIRGTGPNAGRHVVGVSATKPKPAQIPKGDRSVRTGGGLFLTLAPPKPTKPAARAAAPKAPAPHVAPKPPPKPRRPPLRRPG